jgi:hypothetical protein
MIKLVLLLIGAALAAALAFYAWTRFRGTSSSTSSSSSSSSSSTSSSSKVSDAQLRDMQNAAFDAALSGGV